MMNAQWQQASSGTTYTGPQTGMATFGPSSGIGMTSPANIENIEVGF